MVDDEEIITVCKNRYILKLIISTVPTKLRIILSLRSMLNEFH